LPPLAIIIASHEAGCRATLRAFRQAGGIPCAVVLPVSTILLPVGTIAHGGSHGRTPRRKDYNSRQRLRFLPAPSSAEREERDDLKSLIAKVLRTSLKLQREALHRGGSDFRLRGETLLVH
jgi:hypothetical protein